ncbi:MAG TPA: hypothetical protein VD978_19085 [Azospirillum sp.]|nr:hypothetical protein [Azospirillum sp.]
METAFINGEEAAKVTFLSSPDAYAGRPEVAVIESSMSWVFLAGTLAFKMKKPIRRPFLDYTSLTARQRSCEQEVVLNRRLAPDVYHGVAPLIQTAPGRFRIGGEGRLVETLVKMRRLPPEDMLDQRIARGNVRDDDIERIAGCLARFYVGTGAAETDPAAYIQRIRRYVVDNLSDLRESAPPELREVAERSCRDQLAALDGRPELFGDRVRAGRIVEGHGDLRPEHVYVAEPPQIIDCLEFRRELRLIDPADELSLLAMECERLGGGAIGNAILNRCAAAMNDAFPDRLVRFHKSFRACLRARMALWHTRDLSKWHERAAQYLGLAARFSPDGG